MARTWVDESPFERRSLQAGMRVRTSDGQTLGRVACVGQTRFYIRKRFSKRWVAVALARVERIHVGDVFVSGTAAEVAEPVTREMLAAEIPTYTHPLAEASGPAHVS
jgi:hypothetical protein